MLSDKNVTIVLATYNGQKYIKEQLDSLVRQTYPVHEIIVADDKSTDNTMDIIKEYVQNYSNINWIVYQNEINIGWRSNFIKAIKKSEGDLIFLSDQDDIWENDKIAKMVDAFNLTQDAEVIACNLQPIYETGGTKINNITIKKYGRAKIQKVDNVKYYCNMLRPGCCMGFKKELIPIINETWEEEMAHDALIYDIGAFREGLYIYNERLIYQRRHALNNSPHSPHDKNNRLKLINERRRRLQNIFAAEHSDLTSHEKQQLEKCIQYYDFRANLIKNKKLKDCLNGIVKYRKYYPKLTSYIADFLCR